MTSSNQSNGNTKTWELSLYEQERKPQPIITSDTPIAVSPRSLHSELMCPICLDMLKNTHTTKECLHRFCHDCIVTAIRSSNKECPTCRKKLASKRALRPDPNFDMLISRIYPSRDEYEAQQASVIAHVNQRMMYNNIQETLEQQALNRSRNRRSNNSANATDPDSTIASENGEGEADCEDQSDIDTEEVIQDIDLQVNPLPSQAHQDESLNQVRYLQMNTAATIDHVARYLEMRFNLRSNQPVDPENDENSLGLPFTLYVNAGPAQFDPLPGSMTLIQVHEKYFKKDKPLQLFYASNINPSS